MSQIRPQYVILNLGDIKSVDRFLFYGQTGVGKTFILGSAMDVEAYKPCLYVGLDNSWRTISKRKVTAVMPENFQTLLTLIRDVTRGGLPYRSLLIDGIDMAYGMMLQEALATTSTMRFHPAVPSQQDYLVGTSRFRSLLKLMLKIPIPIIATCHRVAIKDATNLVSIYPSLPGKLAEEVGQYFDFIGYMYVREMNKKLTYYCQFSPFGRILAKERVVPGEPALGPVMESPSFPRIYNALYKGEEVRKGPLTKLDDQEAALVERAELVATETQPGLQLESTTHEEEHDGTQLS